LWRCFAEPAATGMDEHGIFFISVARKLSRVAP
jgi:hypothetical protein